MRKSFKTFLFSLLVLPCAILFSACGGPNVIYQADFSKSDSNAFVSYEQSTVSIDTKNKTVTLGKNSKNQAANTFFGNNETKNTEVDFSKAVVSIKIEINSDSMENEQGFTWTVSVNGKKDETAQSYSFKSERSIYFRKVNDVVKVGYTFNGSSDAINETATSTEKAKALSNGIYDVNFAFQTNENNVVTIKITVVNDKGEVVFEQNDVSLGNSEKDNADTGEYSSVKTDELGGLRYGWFSWMNVDSVKVYDLKVTQ